MKHYDYLIVGSGLYGAVFTRQALDAGKSCLVLEKRAHTGGNIRCERIEGIDVHVYGAHIFHTASRPATATRTPRSRIIRASCITCPST